MSYEVENKTPDGQSSAPKNKKKKSVLRRIIDVISTIVLVLAFAILGFSIYSRMTGSNPTIFGFNFYLVLTDSMTPEIHPDDLVIAKEVDATELSVGDDIVFISKNSDSKGVRLVHRIINIEDGLIYTKGIKEGLIADTPIPMTNVLGKVVAHSTVLGFIPAVFTRYPQIAFGILIGIMVLLVFVLFIDVVKAFMLPADGENPAEQVDERKEKLSKDEQIALDAREQAKEEVERKFYDCDDPITPDEDLETPEIDEE